jgi:hypothetical protein
MSPIQRLASRPSTHEGVADTKRCEYVVTANEAHGSQSEESKSYAVSEEIFMIHKHAHLCPLEGDASDAERS